VFVADFIFGGMENTTASTLTDAVLHDARAHLDYSAEPLIAHELMHQWFGDLLTCRDWPHGWLNEGFATYGEILWKAHSEGADEGDEYRSQDLRDYLDEAGSSYARPIVARKFHLPIELFDRHLYQKGGLVLHELRRRLGDALFFRAVRHYVATCGGRSVETVDFARAIEEATGRNFDRFFDQYVFGAGHPELKIEVVPERDEKRLKLKVRQAQVKGKEKEPEGTVFQLPLEVRVVTGGKERTHTVALTDAEHVFYFPAEGPVTQVRVDPRREILGTLEVEKPASMWMEELARAPEAMARSEAARALGKEGSAAAVEALGRGLQKDAFWATRAACAKALARVRSPQSRRELLEGVKVPHPKARRAVMAALCEFRGHDEVTGALRRTCEKGDESYFVEAEAARSFGKLRVPGGLQVLEKVAARASFQDVVAAAALDGMASTLDPAAYPYVESRTAYGHPPFLRRAATVALGGLAEAAQRKREAVDVLGQLFADPQLRVQLAAIQAAETLGDRRVLPALERTPFRDGRAQRMAKEAARALRETEPQAKEVHALREELDKLKEETRALRERLDGMKPAPAARKVGRRKGR
jgi:aminopeptidase N